MFIMLIIMLIIMLSMPIILLIMLMLMFIILITISPISACTIGVLAETEGLGEVCRQKVQRSRVPGAGCRVPGAGICDT